MRVYEGFSFFVALQTLNGQEWVFFIDDTPESLEALENELLQLVKDGLFSRRKAMDALESIESRIEATDG